MTPEQAVAHFATRWQWRHLNLTLHCKSWFNHSRLINSALIIWRGVTEGFRLTQCGSTERHDAVEWERSSLELHVLVTGLHLHSPLIKKDNNRKQVWEVITVTVTIFIYYRRDLLCKLQLIISVKVQYHKSDSEAAIFTLVSQWCLDYIKDCSIPELVTNVAVRNISRTSENTILIKSNLKSILCYSTAWIFSQLFQSYIIHSENCQP